MLNRTSSTQAYFEKTLRNASISSKQQRQSSLNKQQFQFDQIKDHIAKNVKSIETTNVSQNLQSFIVYEELTLRQHVKCNLFIPERIDLIGEKILGLGDYWILHLLSFELFAKKGEVQDAQFLKIIQKMRLCLGHKMAQEVQIQAHNLMINEGDKPNFIRIIYDENSNRAQCQCCSQQRQSVKKDKINIQDPSITNNLDYHVITQFTQKENLEKNLDEVSEINENSQFQLIIQTNCPNYSTEQIEEKNQIIQQNQFIQPFVNEQVYYLDPEQKELDQLVMEDQEQHEKERQEITKDFFNNTTNHFTSQQNITNNSKKRTSHSMVDIEINYEQLKKLGSGYEVLQKTLTTSEKDSQKDFQLRRFSLRTKKQNNKENDNQQIQQNGE